jgi:hypothetical protein
LQCLGFNIRGKTITEVQELAMSQNIPIRLEEGDIVKGWVGKLIGVRQVLWERGLLGPQVMDIAKIKNVIPIWKKGWSMQQSLLTVLNFLVKKTSLMYFGENLGVEVDHSTKYRPKLTGEGVE